MGSRGRIPSLTPDNQFPELAIQRSVQEFPKQDTSGGWTFTWNIKSAADKILPWGRNVVARDRQLRDFWPTETYLAGAVANVAFRNAAFEWEIRGGGKKVEQAVTDILTAAIAGDSFGWVPFMQKFSQDLYTTDNGGIIELIRDPGLDANSRFQGALAPVLGLAHLDSNQCTRTGNPEYPIVYTDRLGEKHKLRWYQVIPFSDYPSAIEKMNGVGICAVSRVLKMAQVMWATINYKDEKVSGRHYKQMHFVSGVSRQDIKDEMKRGQEDANNTGLLTFILPSILASLDPEKPVSTATIDLAGLPDGFDYDQDMKWYISSLALGFGVDYQEFAPLPGGNIGSSQQSMILHRKGSGKEPAVFMRLLSEGFANYGLLPRGVKMRFNDKDEQEALERQEVRTKAMEEAAIATRSYILTPNASRKDLVRRGIYEPETINGVPEEYGIKQLDKNQGKNPVGQIGGNTMLEDVERNETGVQDETVGGRLRKAYEIYMQTVQEEKQILEEQNMIAVLKKYIGAAMKELRSELKKDTPAVAVPYTKPVRVIVNMPKLTGQKQKVVRDIKGDIDHTVTEMTYEEKDAKSMWQGNGNQTVVVKMPRVAQQNQKVMRNAKGDIDHTVTEMTYED